MEHQMNFMEYRSYSGTPSFYEMSRSFHAIQRSILYKEAIRKYQEPFMQYQEALMEYPGAFAEYREALSNTMELYRTAWSSKEYEEGAHVYQVADEKYQKGLWNTRKLWRKTVVNSCPDSAKQKTSQDPPKWRPGANVCIFKRFWTDLGYHFGPTFGPKNYHMLQKNAFENRCPKMKKSHVNQAKARLKFHQMVPKR